jgi:hypothetical protein
MNAAAYPLAAIPEPYQILGLKLKPYCLGHYFLLSRFGVAFASDDETEADLNDLLMGCLICSHTYEGFLDFLESPDFKKQIQDWGKVIGLDFDLSEKVALFNKYISDACHQPTVIYEGESSQSGAHWSQVLKCALIASGYDETTALNMPLAQAFADFYRNAETDGSVTIVTPEIAELMRQAENPLPESGNATPFPFTTPPEVYGN